MAAYLSLTAKSDGKQYFGQGLVRVDEMMCEALGVEVDEIDFYRNWVDRMGFTIAVTNKPIAEALDRYRKVDVNGFEPYAEDLPVCDWLIENFENSSYYGR
jgi:hypothetical protein